jgi:hypothetical protein
MMLEEFSKYVFSRISVLTLDMIPILVTEQGVFSPPETGDICQEHKTDIEAISFWKNRGYKPFIIRFYG